MRHLVLGTAGHIDHGKTALVRALTGQDTDRLPEEKRRGITIDLGFARLQLPGVEYAVVDVPGHESLVRNMLAGASGVDTVLLVVAADEGIMPQTREHLAIMELLAVGRAVVAVTKSDLVEEDWLELVLDELRTELATTRFAGAPLVPVSAVTGRGLDELRTQLATAAGGAAPRVVADLFRLPIDRAFTIHGTGTVVTGTIWSGRVSADASLRALPGDLAVRVRGLQRHGEPSAAACAGERVALAVAVPRAVLERGATLVDHDGWQLSGTLTVQLRVLERASLRARQRVRVHLGTSESLARLATFGRAQLEPGEVTWAQLRLETPLVARAGDRFVVRSYSPVHTVAGGTVAEPLAPRRKRLDEPDVVRLQAVLEGRAPVAAVVALNGRSGVRAAQLPLLTGRPPDELAEPPESDVFAAGDRLFPRALADAARTRMLAAVADFHLTHPLEQGAPREALRRAAGLGLPAPLLDQVTAELVRAGRLTARGPLFAEPGFAPRLDPRREELAAAFCRALAQAGIAAPRLAELPQPLRADPDLPAIARLLAEQGRVVAVAPDLYADPAAIRAARNTLLDSFREQPRQSASRLREVLGLTRKHLIPLLEFFDRSGVTRRDGDERVAGPAAQSASGGPV